MRVSVRFLESAGGNLGSQLLEGVRVLDLSRILAAPFCTQLLGDMGAEVVKVERPGQGDDTRQWGPPFTERGGEAAYYLAVNRSKKSVAIDFGQKEGRDLILNLATHCHVVVENFPPETLPRYGLGYQDFARVNPRIVMASVSGFGATGPYKNRPSYDLMASGTGGLLGVTGSPAEPAKVGVAISDVCAGLYAHGAILAALRKVEKSPDAEGCHIDVSLLDTQVATLVNVASSFLVSHKIPARFGTSHASIVPYRAFAVSDGHLIVGALNDVQWKRLCHMLGISEEIEQKYATNPLRVEHRTQVDGLLQDLLCRESMSHWMGMLEEARVPYAPINNMEQVFEDPHIQHRRMVQHVPHPTAGEVPLISPPVRFNGEQPEIVLAPPTLGQHTKQVLTDLLGLSESDLVGFKEKGVIQYE